MAPAAAGSTNPGDSGAQPRPQGGSVVVFAVEVWVDRPDPRLRPGMSARCAIIIGRRRGVLRAPKTAIVGKPGAETAEVVTREKRGEKTVDRFARRDVKAGLRGDSFVEILEGLKEGEMVKPSPYTGPPRKSLEFSASVGND